MLITIRKKSSFQALIHFVHSLYPFQIHLKVTYLTRRRICFLFRTCHRSTCGNFRHRWCSFQQGCCVCTTGNIFLWCNISITSKTRKMLFYQRRWRDSRLFDRFRLFRLLFVIAVLSTSLFRVLLVEFPTVSNSISGINITSVSTSLTRVGIVVISRGAIGLGSSRALCS